MTNYTAILEVSNIRLIKNVALITEKTDDILNVELLNHEDGPSDGLYLIKIKFNSTLHRLHVVERLTIRLNCCVIKLYNIHRDGKEYEWE